jgi:hypothetical protein
MAEDEGDGEGGDDGPSMTSMVAGALVAIVAVIVAIALLASSGVGDLLANEDDDDLDVAVVGDSFADQSRVAFLELVADDELTVEYFAYGGTSICGWQDEIDALAEREPDQLVLSFAGNDLQPCINPDGATRTPEQVAADYRTDLERIVEQFRPTGTDLYVVDPPPIRDPQFEANAEAMREMYRSAAIDHPRITVIDPDDELGPDGAFHAALPCEEGDECGADGTVVLRQPDGIHLTPAGGRRYALAVLEALERDRL